MGGHTMKTSIPPAFIVAAALILAGTSGTPAFADNTANTYHQSAFIDLPAGSTPLMSFDISFVERSSQTYYLADRSNKAVDIFDASSNTFETRLTGWPASRRRDRVRPERQADPHRQRRGHATVREPDRHADPRNRGQDQLRRRDRRARAAGLGSRDAPLLHVRARDHHPFGRRGRGDRSAHTLRGRPV